MRKMFQLNNYDTWVSRFVQYWDCNKLFSKYCVIAVKCIATRMPGLLTWCPTYYLCIWKISCDFWSNRKQYVFKMNCINLHAFPFGIQPIRICFQLELCLSNLNSINFKCCSVCSDDFLLYSNFYSPSQKPIFIRILWFISNCFTCRQKCTQK